MYRPTHSLLALAAALSLAQAFAGQPSPAALQAQAKVSQEQASRSALARVPKAEVKSAELEREHGKLIWSFDLAQRGRSGITEVQVDAINGKIVSVQRETAAQESSEANQEAKEK
ncbi:MAG: PepSY domain-containing protein [Burkholderiales bacterium]